MNIVQFPTRGPVDFARTLREVAAGIEAGEYGEPIGLLCMVETIESIAILRAGEAAEPIRAIGLMEAGKQVMLRGEEE